MKSLIAFLLFSIPLVSYGSETVNYIPKNKKIDEVKYELIEDKNYSFNEILNNQNLLFRENNSLFLSKPTFYWVRIKFYNPSEYSVNYTLFAFPQIENTLYFYDLDQSKWVSKKEGLLVYNKNLISGLFKLKIAPKSNQVLYFKMNVKALKNSPNILATNFIFEEQSEVEEQIQMRVVIGTLTIGALFLFLLYSILLYFNLKDRAYIYYQIILVGALLYITANSKFFNVLFNYKYCTFYLSPNGGLYNFSINAFVGRLSTVIILFGFVQLSRLYLQTKNNQPKADRILKILFILFFVLVTCSSFLALYGFLYVDVKTLLYQNLLMVCIPLLLFFIAFKTLNYNKKLAKYFIIANIFPLLVMIIFAGYFVFFPSLNNGTVMLISVAMLTIALTFAFALVGRFNLIKDELNTLELETTKIKSQTEMMKLKLEMNQQELISSTIYTAQKNELLSDLKNEIEVLSQNSKIENKESINKLKSIIQNNLVFDSNFENFKIHFEQVHPDFFINLLKSYPNLSQSELRLSAYLHLNLSNKEIATLLNINPDSVKKAKMRLKAKRNG